MAPLMKVTVIGLKKKGLQMYKVWVISYKVQVQ